MQTTFLLIAIIGAAYGQWQNRPHISEFRTRYFENAAVGTDSKLCSDIAADIIKSGGSAVDAAISIVFCFSVSTPHHAGFGGGFLMTIREPNGKVVTLDGREMAPGAAHENMFAENPSASVLGGLSIAVPGAPKALYAAHQRYGQVPWARVLEPVARAACDGFQVEWSLALRISKKLSAIRSRPEMAAVYLDAQGNPKREGDTIVDPKLCVTLKHIAEHPSDYWEGALAKDIEADIKENDGIVTAGDLLDYEPLWKLPVVYKLKGHKFYTVHPPGSGLLVGQVLAILNHYDFEDYGSVEPGEEGPLFYHRLAEAFKHAYAKRSALADDNFFNMTGYERAFLHPRYVEALYTKIDDERTQELEYYDPFLTQVATARSGETVSQTRRRRSAESLSHVEGDVEAESVGDEDRDAAASPHPFGVGGNTCHSVVVDPHGTAVSFTNSVNFAFGSLVKGRRTGILFNDLMDDFSQPNVVNMYGFQPSPRNYIAPGKRPMSSMSPTIVTDADTGELVLLTGSAGGSRIISTVSQLLLRTIWQGMSLTDAMQAPRIHHQLLPNKLNIERGGLPKSTIEALELKGHNIKNISWSMSMTNGIMRSGSRWEVACDYRRGGHPSGF